MIKHPEIWIHRMKGLTFCGILFIAIVVPCYSQQHENNQILSDIGLSYGASFIAHKDHKLIGSGSALSQYCIGISSTINLTNKIATDFGISLLTSEKKIWEGLIDIGYPISNPVHSYSELRTIYFNFPIHLNYKLIDTNPIKVYISSGPEILIRRFYYLNNPNWVGNYDQGVDFSFGAGMEIGFIESIKITNRFGLYASQYYGRLHLGALRNIESLDLRIGLTYKFKQKLQSTLQSTKI